ncbi:N-acetyltransferase family protein [Gynuella sp.]|uniref:GNAT family N-acetyltransferase n=1 Tax=Gynuella sp. TaxID=2969146 RepID=UPI003D1339AA
MDLEFKVINLERDFDSCVAARKDAYLCSFGHYEGFDDFLTGYRERIAERLLLQEWSYVHVWNGKNIAGQLEFRTFSSEPRTGYIHLIYLKPEYRGLGLAQQLQDHIFSVLLKASCNRAILSVSRSNQRALNFYQRNGWKYCRPNPKHAETDYYESVLLVE